MSVCLDGGGNVARLFFEDERGEVGIFMFALNYKGTVRFFSLSLIRRFNPALSMHIDH